MEIAPISSTYFPPGFRFHPSDEELIVHYLLKKLGSRPLPAQVVAEIDLYSYNPWELPKKALFGEDEWYFFTPRDRKYPNGARPNRTASSGFWKATGTDKPILSASGARRIGVKKALVFYTGRPPKGLKTDWIMNEFRLPDTTRPTRLNGSMRLDDWVLCRVHQKGNKSNKTTWADSPCKLVSFMPNIEEVPSAYTAANTGITTDYLLKDCKILASTLARQHISSIKNISNAPFPQRNNSNDRDDTSGNGNSFNMNSFFQNLLSPTTPRLSDGNRAYNHLIDTEMLVVEENSNEVFSSGNMLNANAVHLYNQNQAIFNPVHSDSTMTLLLSQENF